jgi:hypothetical protein
VGQRTRIYASAAGPGVDRREYRTSGAHGKKLRMPTHPVGARSRIQLGPNQFAFVSRFVGHASMYSGNPEKKNGPALHKNMIPAAQPCGTSALFSCQLGAFAAAAVGVASPLSGLSQLKGLQGSLALAMASKAFRFINSSSDKSLFSATKLAAVRCWGGVGAAAAASVGFDHMRHTSVSAVSCGARASFSRNLQVFTELGQPETVVFTFFS